MPDALGVLWTVAAALAVLAPVLRPGVSLGSYDLLSRIGLTQQAHVAVHSLFPADQILYFAPLTNLAWHQVHSGQWPLWNPYNLMGVPLAFDWQSGVFSLPVALSYLVPVHDAYMVIVLAKLVIAGTGAYTLCRVLGLRPLSAAFGGTAFELSGPMVHYSGWAMTGVTCYAGFIVAATLLLVRGRHRVRHSAFLAISIALAVYGGHPESLVVLGVSFVVFAAVVIGLRARTPGEALRRPVTDVVVAAACGAGLGAPLLLPGLQIAQLSGRAAASGGAAYPLSHLSDLMVGLQGTDFRVPSPYLGVLAVVLAVVGARLWWRRAEVKGLVAVAVVGLVLTYQSPLSSILQHAPLSGRITWNRDVMLVGLAVAVLGACGLDAVVGGEERATARRWALGGFGVSALVVGAVGAAVAGGVQHTSGGDRAPLVWAAAEVVAGLALVAWAVPAAGAPGRAGSPAHRRVLGAGFVAMQGALLVALGVSFWSISSQPFTTTAAVRTLKQTVGDATVGIGPCRPLPFSAPYSTEPGIRPNANVAYGVHEFAVYEPVLPNFYYRSWTSVSGRQLRSDLRRVGLFCPQMTSAGEARVYGVSYLLEAPGTPAPQGTTALRTIAGETLYRVSGTGAATLSALAPAGRPLAADAPASPVAVRHPTDASWQVRTDRSAPSVLRLRLTALPGWHATIDGRPLALTTWGDGAMWQATIPPGRHVVDLSYWPGLFSAGLVVGGAVVAGLVVAGAVGWRRRRRAQPPLASPSHSRVPSSANSSSL